MFETSTPTTNSNPYTYATANSDTPSRPLPSRSDLQAAFNWLVQQPESVRKLATDTEKLMTMFQRATRPAAAAPISSASFVSQTESSGTWSSESPASAAAFVQDLRQINQALQQFDASPAQATRAMPQAAAANAAASPNPMAANSPTQDPSIAKPPAQAMKFEVSSARPAAPSASSLSVEALHPRSQAMLGEVREKLNLSSDVEALNVLIAAGFKSLKSLIS